MKKILHTILLVLMMVPNLIMAQQDAGTISKTWSFPVVYKYDEEVTWYFDLTGTTFAPNENVYLWIWSPSEPDAGHFDNSSEFAKLTFVEGMTWKMTLTPTAYFSMTPEAIASSAGFWFRLKDKTGTKQTGVGQIAYTDFSSFYTANEMIKSYPAQPVINQGVSILFNSNLVPGFQTASEVHFHSGLNNWDVKVEYQAWIPESVTKTKMKNLGNGFYKMDLVPSEYYATVDGYVMENIVFLMVADNWAATSPDQIIHAGEYVAPPPPDFRFFPLNISKKDFLGIIRKNNEPGITKLLYTITANSVVLNGEFTGGVSEIKGFVNLVTALKDVPNVTEIHVLVKDNNNRTISDTTIPLKTVD